MGTPRTPANTPTRAVQLAAFRNVLGAVIDRQQAVIAANVRQSASQLTLLIFLLSQLESDLFVCGVF